MEKRRAFEGGGRLEDLVQILSLYSPGWIRGAHGREHTRY